MTEQEFSIKSEQLKSSCSSFNEFKSKVDELVKNDPVLDEQGNVCTIEIKSMFFNKENVKMETKEIQELVEKSIQASVASEMAKYAPKKETPRGEFKSMGEMAKAIMLLRKGGQADPRLALYTKAPSNWQSEGTGTDGGFAVPPVFVPEIKDVPGFRPTVLPLFNVEITAGNSIEFVVDETAPWNTASGIQAYWGAEGAQKTSSKAALTSKLIKLEKVYALVNATDELLEDAPRFEAHLTRKAPQVIQAKIDNALINGTGVGEPLGLLNAGSKVTVTRANASQISVLDLTKLKSQVLHNDISELAFIASPTAIAYMEYQQFAGWTGVIGERSPNTMSPVAYMLGIPVISSQFAKALGTSGDVICVNRNGYLVGAKGSTPKFDISRDLYFDYDMTAFRFVYRLNGLPMLNTTITGGDGSTTYSHISVLS